MLGNPLKRVARLNGALLNHAEVKAGALALQKPLHHIRTVKANSKFEAGHTGFGHDNTGAAYSKFITYANCLLVYSINGEVLSEAAPSKLTVPKFAPQ